MCGSTSLTSVIFGRDAVVCDCSGAAESTPLAGSVMVMTFLSALRAPASTLFGVSSPLLLWSAAIEISKAASCIAHSPSEEVEIEEGSLSAFLTVSRWICCPACVKEAIMALLTANKGNVRVRLSALVVVLHGSLKMYMEKLNNFEHTHHRITSDHHGVLESSRSRARGSH